ncbi:cytochrome c maturation protein CcmE [Hirschia baltica]|uniref:Cytochrome c-type biogenesis protein CcmE n=1 Tax=Hirschia baltica (strain ATCC 49814 / DSM 5838 / IFAM 1418) TaxID=582402 RepID=C6XIM0_HIRBI|nr:cytochrome c maturation protein CcmE [Hirschia baltica]ACT58965.1 CcmE/CycJ protein [Hirschia baltica ATCC 49814]
MRARSQRAWLIGVAGVLLVGAVALVMSALGDNASYSRTPTEIVTGNVVTVGERVRIGGLVGVDSIERGPGTLIKFEITDGEYGVNVAYDDLPPDLFEEGQGIVAEGIIQVDGSLQATRLVARHDESYMPKEAYDALKAAGGEAAAKAAQYNDEGV